MSDGYFGRLNDPTASSYVRGACGDEIEFYLVIRDETLLEVRYYTEGCENTRASGEAVARRATGKRVNEALKISPGDLFAAGEGEPEEGRHCAILVVTTFYRAVADYLLQP